MASPRHPDLLVIVLDCVSARDFCGGENPVPGLSAAQSLAKESVLYGRAVAPASWTFPSHASMFTGITPWEGGMYGSKISNWNLGRETLAEKLRSAGFQTGAFSANPFISSQFGLNRGFESSRWGSFADCSLRKLTTWISRAQGDCPGDGIARLVSNISKSNQIAIGEAIRGFPIAVDAATRLASLALGGRYDSPSRVAPWIESSMEKWLRAASGDKPLFCFVNLLDAHEPFVGLPEKIDDVADWLRSLLVSQRERSPDGEPVLIHPRHGETLRSLYRMAIKILDLRLETLLRTFKNLRDWDNTCVVVTSDHGQAFGDEHLLFHAWGIPDSIHRVPLLVKPVLGRGEPEFNRDWTPLTSLPSIIAAATFADDPIARLLSRPAINGLAADSAPLALSLADGGGNRVSLGNGDGSSNFGVLPAIVGYSEEYKVVVNSNTLECSAFSIRHEDGSGGEPTNFVNEPISTLKNAAMEAAVMVHRGYDGRESNDVSRHLRQWGYE